MSINEYFCIFKELHPSSLNFPLCCGKQERGELFKNISVPLYMMTAFQSQGLFDISTFSKVVSDCYKVVLSIFIMTNSWPCQYFYRVVESHHNSVLILHAQFQWVQRSSKIELPFCFHRTPFSTFTLLTSSPLELQAVLQLHIPSVKRVWEQKK